MTVTKKFQNTCTYPSSANTSDTESLHLDALSASDTESINNDFTINNNNRKINKIKFDDHLTLKRNSGKKKQRRYNNKCFLQTLTEEEENENNFIIIAEPIKSPLTRLLEDDDALDFWNRFITKSEEEQNKFIQNGSFQTSTNNKNTNKCDDDKIYHRIPSKIKRLFKIKQDLSLDDVRLLESDLIDYLQNNPQDIYVKFPPTYFERLLFYGLAHYHRLHSIGSLEDGKKKVVIFSTTETWLPAKQFLTDYIAKLRR